MVLAWINRRWFMEDYLNRVIFSCAGIFVVLAIIGNGLSLLIFIKESRRQSYCWHQVGLLAMDIGGMFMTATHGIQGLLVHIVGMRLKCNHPWLLRLAVYLEAGSASFSLVSFILLAIAAADWAQALYDFDAYKKLPHGVRALQANGLTYALSLVVFVVFLPAIRLTEETLVPEYEEFQKVEPACASLVVDQYFVEANRTGVPADSRLAMNGSEMALASTAAWWKYVALYEPVRQSCLRPKELWQIGFFLSTVVVAYAGFFLSVAAQAVLLVKNRGLAGGMNVDDGAITAFFFFELAMGTVNFFSIAAFNAQEFLAPEERWLSENDGETLQLGSFLLQVSFNFIFFMASSPQYRATLMSLGRKAAKVKPSLSSLGSSRTINVVMASVKLAKQTPTTTKEAWTSKGIE